MIERIQGVCMALLGLVAAFAVLSYGPWQPDTGRLIEDVCHSYGVCAVQTLRITARDLVWSGDPQALDGAIALNQDLVKGDSAEPENWAALGEALSAAGNAAGAEAAFSTAVGLGPNRPDILMRAVNWAFEAGRVDIALPLVRRQLELVRNYDQVLFRLLRLSGLTEDEILTQAIPNEREPLAAYLQFLNGATDAAGAEAVWRRMAELDLLHDEDLSAYVGLMLREGRYDEAVRVQRANAGADDANWPEGNLVFNGGFETEPLGAALDWRIPAHQNVDVEMDGEVKASGARSLRIHFLGTENVRFAHVTQTVLVQPGGQYRLSAQVRADGVTTDEGLRIELRGRPRDGSTFTAATDSILGTQDWRPVSLPFRAPAGLEQVDIIFTRRASRKFDNKIQGDVWIDDVSLKAL